MKIEMEINDLKATIDGLNNALHAYNDLIFAITMGCEVPKKYDGIKRHSENELTYRLDCTKELYEQLLTIEMEAVQNEAKRID